MADSPGAHPDNGARTLRCPGPVAVPANDTGAGRTFPSASSSSRPCGAKEWVAGYLSARGGEAPAAEVIEAGRALGYPSSTLKNARAKVADSIRVGFGRAQKTYWRLRAGLAAAGAPAADTSGLVGATGPTAPAGLAAVTEPAAPAEPADPESPAGHTGSVQRADVASPQRARSSRARRARPRSTGRPASGAAMEQPTLFAVMGVSEP